MDAASRLDDRRRARGTETVRSNGVGQVLQDAITQVLDLSPQNIPHLPRRTLPEVVDAGVELVRDLVAEILGNDDLARTRQGQQSCSDVYVRPENVDISDHDLAAIRTHAQQHSLLRRQRGIQIRECVLDFESGCNRLPWLDELKHEAVPETLHQAAAMRRHHFADHEVQHLLPSPHRTLLVLIDQSNGVDHIGNEHGSNDQPQVIA